MYRCLLCSGGEKVSGSDLCAPCLAVADRADGVYQEPMIVSGGSPGIDKLRTGAQCVREFLRWTLDTVSAWTVWQEYNAHMLQVLDEASLGFPDYPEHMLPDWE